MKKAKWILPYISKYKAMWFGGFFFQVAFLGCYQICNAYALEYIGNGMVNLSETLLIKGLVIFGTGALLATMAENMYWRLTGKSLALIRRDIKVDVFSALLGQEGITAEEDSAEKMEYINQDVELVMGMAGDSLKQLVLGVGTSIIAMAAIMSKHTAIGLFCIAGFLISVLINVYYIVKQKNIVLERISCTNKVNMVYTDMLYGAKTIRNMNQQGFMKQNIEREAENLRKIKRKERKIGFTQNILSRLFLCLNNLVPMAMGIYFCAKGRMPVGTVFFLVQIILQFNNDYEMIGPAIVELSKDMAGAERIQGVLKETSRIEAQVEYNNPQTENKEKSGLEISNLKVTYGSGKGIHINHMELQENMAIALIGKSGSGKSTLFKVLLQMIPFQGDMTYSGNAVGYKGDYNFRNQIAYAGSESKLFDGKSIFENISYGRKGCTMNEISEIFKRIGGEEFILNLKNGYETVIGEEGLQLSGGEEQRIILVRALVKHAPIVLLDEITSAVNTEIKDKIYNYIQQEKKKRIFIFSTHDMEFAHQADWVVVMKEGEVSAQGVPQAVL